ncbi:MAG: type II toxin-antitoxin system prevent-host-death family antitoxin [bacterium]|nr:type II toxin-antitoxin system prevent-host-death family antitoxin [bacterium]
MPEVGIRALRENLSRYINLVREGEEVVVTDRGKAVVRIVPIDQPGLLERLVAEGVVTPPLNKERRLPSRRITPTSPVSPLVVEDRR